MECCSSNNNTTNSKILLAKAAGELEAVRWVPKHDGVRFPAICQKLLYSLQGNRHCVDCGSPNPDWASVTYGTLLCLQCSGRHRSYGVKTSFVRSVDMDTWSHDQILSMLEGGNGQMQAFFDRHDMGKSSPISTRRYQTKAARFYRTHLAQHVRVVSGAGIYQGRDASRSRQQHSPVLPRRSSSNHSKSTQTTTSTITTTTSSSSGGNNKKHSLLSCTTEQAVAERGPSNAGLVRRATEV